MNAHEQIMESYLDQDGIDWSINPDEVETAQDVQVAEPFVSPF